jgi:hypothetical protein
MGTKMAPCYANIFMGELEERLILSSLKQPLSWFRFIDDVDMKWIHSDKELDECFEHANSIHQSIKFTHEVSKTKMSFLDTTTAVGHVGLHKTYNDLKAHYANISREVIKTFLKLCEHCSKEKTF